MTGNVRWRTLIALTTMLLLVGVAQIASPSPPSVRAVPPTSEPPHRYVVLLDGIRSEGVDVPGRYRSIYDSINGSVPHVAAIVYFSYGAAYFHEGGDFYCSGWGVGGCANDGSGDLAALTQLPIYPSDATKISVDEQVLALD